MAGRRCGITEYITGERELLPGLTVRDDLAELVRCRDCANWGAMGATHAPRLVPSRAEVHAPVGLVCWMSWREEMRKGRP